MLAHVPPAPSRRRHSGVQRGRQDRGDDPLGARGSSISVIVVDDGSWRCHRRVVARRAARRASGRRGGGGRQVEVIVHARNRGVGGAIAVTGCARARAGRSATTRRRRSWPATARWIRPTFRAPCLGGAGRRRRRRLRQGESVRLAGRVAADAAGAPGGERCALLADPRGVGVLGGCSTRSAATRCRPRERPRWRRSVPSGCSRATDIRTTFWPAWARPARASSTCPSARSTGRAWRSGLRPSRVALPLAWPSLRSSVASSFSTVRVRRPRADPRRGL